MVRFLLDTHAFIWWADDEHGRLSSKAQRAIADPENTVLVSTVTIWEIVIKQSLGKLKAPADCESALRLSGFEPLPIEIEHALAVAQLPRVHTDPFDRMLAAQAKVEKLTLVTRDPRLAQYGVAVLMA